MPENTEPGIRPIDSSYISGRPRLGNRFSSFSMKANPTDATMTEMSDIYQAAGPNWDVTIAGLVNNTFAIIVIAQSQVAS